MKIEVNNRTPLMMGLIISFTYFYTSIMVGITQNRSIQELQSSYEKSQKNLTKTYKTLEVVTKELQSYKATEQSLMSLGASSVEAKQVIIASEAYGINPKH
jgi:hypothetical protein